MQCFSHWTLRSGLGRRWTFFGGERREESLQEYDTCVRTTLVITTFLSRVFGTFRASMSFSTRRLVQILRC